VEMTLTLTLRGRSPHIREIHEIFLCLLGAHIAMISRTAFFFVTVFLLEKMVWTSLVQQQIN
jgi:hypothetical protein